MPRYAIHWSDYNGNRVAELIEADGPEEARKQAYEAFRQDFEDNADYGAKAVPDAVVDVVGCPHAMVEAYDADGNIVELGKDVVS